MDAIRNGLSQLSAAAPALGGDAEKAAGIVAAAFAAHEAIVSSAASTPKPSSADHFAPILSQVAAIDALVNGPRSAFENHLKHCQALAQACLWMAQPSGFQAYVEETVAAGTFSGNKVLTAVRGTPDASKHQAYIRALNATGAALVALVKDTYPKGLTWAVGGGAAAAAAAPGGSSDIDAVVAAFDAVRDAAKPVDPILEEGAALVAAAASAMKSVVATASTMAKPADPQAVFKPLVDALQKVNEFGDRHARYAGSQLLQLLAEANNAFSWVGVAAGKGKALGHVKDAAEVVEFKINKVVNKTPDFKKFSGSLKAAMTALGGYVASTHEYGLTWASSASAAVSQAATSAASQAGAGVAAVVKSAQDLHAAASSVDAVVGEAAARLVTVANAMEHVVKTAATQVMPADPAATFAPLTGAITQLNEYVSANSRHAMNLQIQAIGEAGNVFAWVAAQGKKSVGHVQDAMEVVGFQATKVQTKFKEHRPMVAALNKTMTSVLSYVSEHHPSGLVWGSAAGAAAAAPAAAPGGKKMPPPPPPPPPKPPAGAATSSSGATGQAGQLFAEINAKGDNITAGLRKVTDAEKVYKQTNREVRTVDESALNAKKRNKFRWEPPRGTPRFELVDGKKWVVEYQRAAEGTGEFVPIDIATPERHQIVTIQRCNGVYVKIGAKINMVQIIESRDVHLWIGDTVGPIDVTGSQGLEISINGNVPSVILAKTSETTVHLGDRLDTEIVTSCTASINVAYNAIDPDTGCVESREIPLPEQFESVRSKNNKMLTKATEHSSA